MPQNSSLIIDCQECLFKWFVTKYISNEDFDKLYRTSVQVRYTKGEYLAKQGVISHNLIFLSKGKVKFNYKTEKGDNVILTISSAPSLLGGINLINEDKSFFSIIAIEEVEACLIKIEVLKELMSSSNQLTLKMIEFVTSIFRDSIFNFINLAHKQVNGRIADILLFLSRSVYKSQSFTLTITRKELSEFASCSQENVIHTLSRFNREGLIRLNSKQIEILDMAKLENISRFG